jgi:hypothetical protein
MDPYVWPLGILVSQVFGHAEISFMIKLYDLEHQLGWYHFRAGFNVRRCFCWPQTSLGKCHTSAGGRDSLGPDA